MAIRAHEVTLRDFLQDDFFRKTMHPGPDIKKFRFPLPMVKLHRLNVKKVATIGARLSALEPYESLRPFLG